MTPLTVFRIVKEIAHFRGMLTEHETWLQKQPRTETTAEEFRRINFWRGVLKTAEQDIVKS